MTQFVDEILGPIESVSKFSPDRFRATITNGFGLASASRFEVEFPDIRKMKKPNGGTTGFSTSSDDRNLTCAAAGLPGKQIGTQPRNLGTMQQPVANTITFPEVSFTFYMPNSYVMRGYFEQWMSCVVQADEVGGFFTGFYDNYKRDVLVRSYTRNARRAFGIQLIDAYPTTINTIELNSQLQGAAVEATVSMSYRTYRTESQYESIFT